jgi:hypothetical protein
MHVCPDIGSCLCLSTHHTACPCLCHPVPPPRLQCKANCDNCQDDASDCRYCKDGFNYNAATMACASA